ncbi:MAG: YqeG family HAD IIIA-type phosphatase, partial [Angelakisella sp.]
MFHRIYDIPVDFFCKKGITTLLLDVDNTLTTHNNRETDDKVMQWLCDIRAVGICPMILSNNTNKRVKPFAEKLGMGYIANAMKPLPMRLHKSLSLMKAEASQVAVIGDQIYTDVLCGRLAGCTTILVEPMQTETHGIFPLKRALELPVLRGYRKMKKDGKQQ